MARKGRNVARKTKSGGAYSVSRLPKEPVAPNMSPTVEEMLSGTSPFSRTEISRVGALGGTPNSSEELTGINISQREGDRFERSEYKMPSESGRTISDADRKRIDALVGEIIGGTKKPKPRPDVGAIERGNNAARRTAQDLATQNFEAGGAALVGGQVKLDKNKDGKISGADFRMMEEGGEAKVKKRKKSKGNMCRGGGAALRGTNFSGTK